jgi:hypothetical protein
VLQTLVDDDKRGRVMSLYTMAFTGTMPIGSLLIGWFAARAGASVAIGVGGGLSVCAALTFGRQLPVLRGIGRPINARMGILPEVARGIQAATHYSTAEGDEGGWSRCCPAFPRLLFGSAAHPDPAPRAWLRFPGRTVTVRTISTKGLTIAVRGAFTGRLDR